MPDQPHQATQPGGREPPVRSAAFCERIFEQLPVPVFVIDVAPADLVPTILDCNAAACAATGYTRAELLGRPSSTVGDSPLDRRQRQEATERLLRGERVRFHTMRRHKDGTLSAVEVLASSFPYAGRMVVLATDCAGAPADGFTQAQAGPGQQVAVEDAERAERRFLEDALRESETMLRLAADVARLRIWEIYLPTRRIRWVAGAEALSEDGAIRAMGLDEALMVIHPDDRLLFEQHMRQALADGGQFQMEYRQGAGARGFRWSEVRGRVIYDQAGQAERVIGAAVDIHERKELEVALTRQSRLHAALAGCLQELLHPGDNEPERQHLLAAVTEQLCLGLDARSVSLWSVEQHAAGRRLALIAAASGAAAPGPPPEDTPSFEAWPELEPAEWQLLEQGRACTRAARGPQAAAAGARGAEDERTYLFPILLSGGLWGILGVAATPAVALSAQEHSLGKTVAEMIQIALRRWGTVDSLTASEERLRLALDAAELGLWEWNFQTGRVEWTEQTARLFGIALDEYEGSFESFARMAHPDDLDQVRASVARAIASGVPTRYPLRIVRPAGEVRWLETLGQAYVDGAGQPLRMLGVAMDITERWAAEEALQRLNTVLELRVQERTAELELANRALHGEIRERRLVEAMLRERERFLERVMAVTPAQVFIFDLITPSTLYTNRGWESLGYGRDEMERLGPFPIATLMHPDDRTRLPAQFERLQKMADEEVLENEFRARHADGSWRWLATRDVVFVRGADGRPVQILGTAIDITAIKEAETELAESFQRIEALNSDLRRSSKLLATIVNSLSDGLALIDRHGIVLMANEALATLYGLGLEAIVDRRWETVCAVTAPLVGRTFQERATATGRLQIERGEAASIVIDLNTFPLLAADGSVEQMVLHIVDVTERLQFEALAIQNERLITTGRLAATIAHEVNSPLQSIQNFLFLASSDDPHERDSHLRLISDEIDRIGELIRRLLDLNRPGKGERKPLDINALVEKILALTAGTLARHRVQVSSELAAQLPRVSGRPDQLTQVMLNLFLNALEAMPQGGRLMIRTYQRTATHEAAQAPPLPGRLVVIEVRDTGPGIAPESLPLIFKPFYTTKPEGTGIGLAISHQIVEQHGGLLTAGNSEGGGAVFCVVLPAAAPD